MQNAFTGTIPLRGDLRIVVRRADSGDVHWRYEIRNTITLVALRGVVNLIAQKNFILSGNPTDPINYRVSFLRVGGYLTAGPVVPAVPPVRADINLTYPAPSAAVPFTIQLGDTEKTLTTSNPFEMKINCTLGAGDLNGWELTEAGLFVRGGTLVTAPAPPVSPAVNLTDPTFYPELFARQIHPAIPKSAAFVVDYDWRIAITA
jgi:hypothetical protein